MSDSQNQPHILLTAAEVDLIQAGVLRSDRLRLEVLEETQAELADEGISSVIRYNHVECRSCRFNIGPGKYLASDRCSVNGERRCADCNPSGRCEKYQPFVPDRSSYVVAVVILVIMLVTLLLCR